MEQEQQGARFRPSDTVDFAIVGSGAAGGILAKELATAGFSVVVLEQGPRLTEADFDHDEFGVFVQNRTSNNPAAQPQTFRATTAEKAQRKWALIYGRLVGGSNAHFTGNFWRLRPIDFNEASTLGGVPGTGRGASQPRPSRPSPFGRGSTLPGSPDAAKCDGASLFCLSLTKSRRAEAVH